MQDIIENQNVTGQEETIEQIKLRDIENELTSNPVNTNEKKSLRIVYFIVFVVGIIVGVWFGTLINDWVEYYNLDSIFIGLIYVGSSLVTAFMFVLLSIPLLKLFLKGAELVEKSVSKYSAKSIVASTIGLIAGLVVAYFAGNIFNSVEAVWLKLLINSFLYCLLGITGLIIGYKRLTEISILSEKKVEELSKNTSMKVLDTSAIIDGRIAEIAKTGFIDGPFVIPEFVLSELRYIADNAEPLKRSRGRKALDLIKEMQKNKNIKVMISDKDFNDQIDVDAKLLKLASHINASVITNDFNLNKVATVMNVKVLNINELANSIRPLALPGEKMTVTIVKQGKDLNQGLAYTPDGTMIVVENGGDNIGDTVEVTVRTSLQTNAGRMIFTRI